MNAADDARLGRRATIERGRIVEEGSSAEVSQVVLPIETVELAVRLPGRWRDTSCIAPAIDSEFKVIRYLGPHLPDSILGGYSLDQLVRGPITAILRHATVAIPGGLAASLGLSCVLDALRQLFDAARSWAPGAVYRLHFRLSNLPTTARVEINGAPDLDRRTCVPAELVERDSRSGEAVDVEWPTLLTAMVTDVAVPGRIATQVDGSGAWWVEFELALDGSGGKRP